MIKKIVHSLAISALLQIIFVASASAASDPQLLLTHVKGNATPETGFFSIDVAINTQSEILNALEGEILYPKNVLQVVAINDSRSLITFWVTRPADQQGVISFKGLSPGGISTNNGRLFTVVFSALPGVQSTVNASVQANNILGYRNDGRGTIVPIVSGSTRVSIPQTANLLTPTSTGQVILPKDTIEPSDLQASISKYENLFNNKWFLAFAARDADSGIDYFEIQESKTAIAIDNAWQKAISPVVLTDQTRKSYVFVRVYDKAGNKREVMLRPMEQNHSIIYTKIVFWCILIMILLFGLAVWRKKKQKLPPTGPQP